MRRSKNSILILALIWTAVTAMWLVTLILRFSGTTYVESEVVLTVFAMVASGVVCGVQWYRYATYGNDKS